MSEYDDEDDGAIQGTLGVGDGQDAVGNRRVRVAIGTGAADERQSGLGRVAEVARERPRMEPGRREGDGHGRGQS